jgi:hypothetical protein
LGTVSIAEAFSSARGLGPTNVEAELFPVRLRERQGPNLQQLAVLKWLSGHRPKYQPENNQKNLKVGIEDA